MKRIVLAIIIFFGLLTLASSVYTISETEQVIITQFGEPVGQPHTDPGLHMKVPFIQTVHVFDKRWLEWSGDPNQIPTRDKKYIWVDTYTRWRVKDPLLFYQRVRDERSAQSRLDDIVDGETRNVIANNDLIEVVRSTDRPFPETEENADVDMGAADVAGKITMGREKITRAIERTSARGLVIDLSGIDVMDSYISRTLRDIGLISQLMGVRAVICGLDPMIAMSLVEMGMDLQGVHAELNLEEALSLLAREAAAREQEQE